MTETELTGRECNRCGHVWLPRDPTQEPTICPKCKSTRWDEPKEFECETCGTTFDTQEWLDLHQRKAHGDLVQHRADIRRPMSQNGASPPLPKPAVSSGDLTFSSMVEGLAEKVRRLHRARRIFSPERVIAARHAASVTQRDLAKLLGISASRLAQWELGRAKPDDSLMPQLVQFIEAIEEAIRDVEEEVMSKQT